MPLCPACHQSILPTDNFCPHCGIDIKNFGKVTVGRQIYIYTVSALAPPFGLIWTVKYLLSSSTQKKWIGIVAGVITIASLLLTIWATMGFFNSVQQQLNNYSNLGL